MAFTYGFYNASDHDRLYDASEMSRIFDGLITDGVYAEVGNKFFIQPSVEDNSVIVGSGRAWFNNTWNYNDTDMLLPGPAPHTVYNRWDAIVIDVQNDNYHRENSLQWIIGTPSASPTKPSLIHTVDHNQYPLAYIYRVVGETTITSVRITNMIGKSECPYCSGLLADTKNIAPVEENERASRQYAQGTYILWHTELYKTTSTINTNATIIAYPDAGYNVKRTTISEELYNTFVFDAVPTKNSSHPVTSNGIYNALQIGVTSRTIQFIFDENMSACTKDFTVTFNKPVNVIGVVGTDLPNNAYIATKNNKKSRVTIHRVIPVNHSGLNAKSNTFKVKIGLVTTGMIDSSSSEFEAVSSTQIAITLYIAYLE